MADGEWAVQRSQSSDFGAKASANGMHNTMAKTPMASG
jgi:hypothetical protein